MANTLYGGGITLDQTIEFTSAAPLDNRVAVKSFEDLDSIENKYIGLMTYVQDDACYYAFDGATWNKIKGGGFYSVDTSAGLSQLKDDEKLQNGEIAYVNEVNTHFAYDASANKWNPLQTGVPAYTRQQIDAIGAENLPSEYMHVPSITDIIGDTIPTDNDLYMVKTQAKGSYLESIFSTLRILQAEIEKIKNTFNYGLYSYTGRDTAMSGVNHMYQDPEYEPLWAIEESDLSTISGLEDVVIGQGTTILPTVSGGIDVSHDGYIIFNCVSLWTPTPKVLEEVEDPKLFLYLTIFNKDVKIKLKDLYYDSNDPDAVDHSFEFDFSQVAGLDVYSKMNVLIVLSRRIKKEDEKTYEVIESGNNYIWISVGDAIKDTTYIEGYWNQDDNILYKDYQEIDAPYYFDQITFGEGVELSKLKIYSKYQDFSKEVIPSKPDDEDYRYKVSHITIRSVDTYDTLKSIKDFLPENELIFEEERKKLWIKNKGQICTISGGGNTSDDNETVMTQEELLEMLNKMGLVYNTSTGQLDVSTLSVGDILFIDQASGKQYSYTTDAYGNLVSTEIPDASILIENRLKKIDPLAENYTSTRGFVGQLGCRELTKSIGALVNEGQDLKLNADRIRISAVYAPLDTDIVYGSTHGYIEIENSSDIDFDLNGSYLHFAELNCKSDGTLNGSQDVIQNCHLKLSGIIKAGSTYLVRCKRYANDSDANAFIKVKTFDQEWYVTNNGKKSLLDLTLRHSTDPNGNPLDFYRAYGISMTYGDPELNITEETEVLWKKYNPNIAITEAQNKYAVSYSSKTPFLFRSSFIDAIQYGTLFKIGSNGPWANYCVPAASNSLIKLTFALDPAKQAFNSTNTIESSRTRWGNKTDMATLSLAKEVIAFPHTDEVKYVSDYTPKASFENKNVISDKSNIDTQKPNMVTCSFGINMYTTRCFNWISGGLFDEYVWIRTKGTTTWNKKFASYTKISKVNEMSGTYPRRFEYNAAQNTASSNELGINLTNAAYARITSRFPGCNTLFTSHKCIVEITEQAISAGGDPVIYEYIVGRADKLGNPDTDHISDINEFTLYPIDYTPQIYLTSDQQGFHWLEYQVWAAAADALNEKIAYDQTHKLCTKTIPADKVINTGSISNPVYKINDNTLLEDGTFNSVMSSRTKPLAFNVSYTQALRDAQNQLTGETVTVSEVFTMNGSDGHDTSKIKNTGTEAAPVYTLVNSTDCSNISITVNNQAGVNAEAANETVTYTLTYYKPINTKIMPILMNSGDMTQNGTRINEWYDYYIGGRNLFNHLEQMNVVGNNDLCNTDITILGTGDDEGKSNSYFYHLFYCYQVSGDELLCPVVKGNDNVVRYIPSLYYFESASNRFLMCNSEITEANCIGWFKMYENTDPINIYTGYTVPQSAGGIATYKGNNFVTIYKMIFNILNNKSDNKLPIKPTIVVCHEMPYTVITNSALLNKTIGEYRSGKSSLIGSHMNQISVKDLKGVHWFSRILEYFNVQLVLGGHKHTYSCTYPVREFFYWNDGGVEKNSRDNYADWVMTDSLENDPAIWTHKYVSGHETNRKALQKFGNKDITADVNLTKFPLVYSEDFGAYGKSGDQEVFFPYTPVPSTDSEFASQPAFTNAVTYFMTQATGYKLTSNKELPSANQKFAQILPNTNTTYDSTAGSFSDSASTEQTYPMFLKVFISSEDNTSSQASNTNAVELIRVDGIMKSGKFTQTTYLTSAVKFQYFRRQNNDHCVAINNGYGQWVNYETPAIELSRPMPKTPTDESSIITG